jgi:hypothetical protein
VCNCGGGEEEELAYLSPAGTSAQSSPQWSSYTKDRIPPGEASSAVRLHTILQQEPAHRRGGRRRTPTKESRDRDHKLNLCAGLPSSPYSHTSPRSSSSIITTATKKQASPPAQHCPLPLLLSPLLHSPGPAGGTGWPVSLTRARGRKEGRPSSVWQQGRQGRRRRRWKRRRRG